MCLGGSPPHSSPAEFSRAPGPAQTAFSLLWIQEAVFPMGPGPVPLGEVQMPFTGVSHPDPFR